MLLLMTDGVTVHGDGFAEPFSNPPFTRSCCVPPALTVSVIEDERVSPPPVPLTVTGYVPDGVDAPVEIVKTEEPVPGAAIDIGLKLAVAAAGRPIAESEMDESNPPDTDDVTVDVPELPTVSVRSDGSVETAKSGETAVVAIFRAKSSKMNEVFRLASSTPTREI